MLEFPFFFLTIFLGEHYKFYLLLIVEYIHRKFTATNCTVVLDTLSRVSVINKCTFVSLSRETILTFAHLTSCHPALLQSRVLVLLNYMFAWALAIS